LCQTFGVNVASSQRHARCPTPWRNEWNLWLFLWNSGHHVERCSKQTFHGASLLIYTLYK
jgi:hypothetical protein